MTVTHDETTHRFVLTLPEGGGHIRYRPLPDGTWNLYHTEVDPALQGHGAASALAEGAFAYARAHGIKLKVTCPYVISWLARHPEERDIVVG